jgi:AcrR family transcriptional regulator
MMMAGRCDFRRRKCAMTTRSEILAAARRHFASESYENVGLRDIARDVGVDVALIGRYFGNKEGLFREVLQSDSPEPPQFDVSSDELPAYLASLVASDDGNSGRVHAEKLLIVLRSASSPVASPLIRERIQADILSPLAKIIGEPNACVRSRMLLSVLLGTKVVEAITATEQMPADDRACMRKGLEKLFAAAVSAG